MPALSLVGRVLYGLLFIVASFAHFSQDAIGYAAAQGVPLAALAVPVSGVLALLGGLSVAAGYRARVGAVLLAAFLVPVTLMMHNFWAVTDPMMAQVQTAMFFKNTALLGAALLILHHGAGPLSVDARQAESARHARAA